jgi:hypothetical protein
MFLEVNAQGKVYIYIESLCPFLFSKGTAAQLASCSMVIVGPFLQRKNDWSIMFITQVYLMLSFKASGAILLLHP